MYIQLHSPHSTSVVHAVFCCSIQYRSCKLLHCSTSTIGLLATMKHSMWSNSMVDMTASHSANIIQTRKTVQLICWRYKHIHHSSLGHHTFMLPHAIALHLELKLSISTICGLPSVGAHRQFRWHEACYVILFIYINMQFCGKHGWLLSPLSIVRRTGYVMWHVPPTTTTTTPRIYTLYYYQKAIINYPCGIFISFSFHFFFILCSWLAVAARNIILSTKFCNMHAPDAVYYIPGHWNENHW